MAHTPAGQEYSYNEDLKENHTVQPNGVVDLNTVGLMKGGADPLLLNYDLVSSLQQSVSDQATAITSLQQSVSAHAAAAYLSQKTATIQATSQATSIANLTETLNFALTQLTIQRQDLNLLETNVAKMESIQIGLETAICQMAPNVNTVMILDSGVAVPVPVSYSAQYNLNSSETLAHSSQYGGGLTQTSVKDDYEAGNPNTTSHQSATLEFIQSIVNEWLNSNNLPD